jgi:hypothetical protein
MAWLCQSQEVTALRFDESEGMQIAVGTSGGQVYFSLNLAIGIPPLWYISKVWLRYLNEVKMSCSRFYSVARMIIAFTSSI